MKLTNTLITALEATSEQIAGDANTNDPEEMAELCVDANRMEIYGYEEAQDEASRLIREFGYDEFLKEAAKHVYC